MDYFIGLLWSIPSIVLYCVIFVYVQGLLFGYIKPPAFLGAIFNPLGAYRRWNRRRAWMRREEN